jgi:6-phosphofructokinase 1
MKRIGVLTSGGDAPGMNAAIRGATLIAQSLGYEVIGVLDGYEGLMRGDFVPLSTEVVGGAQGNGGTLLGSARSSRFLEPEGRREARTQLAKHGVDSLIVIGGNGSLRGLSALIDDSENDSGLRAIGIPASIDNDVGLTRLSLGVDTAINTIVDACDRLADTATSHGRAFIVEVMGRDCGYLAMAAGLSAGAHAVLFPEGGKGKEDLVETVMRALRKASQRPRSRRQALILKAEGVAMSTEELRNEVSRRIREEGLSMDVRVTSLGHVVRGGRPSALDRQLGNRLAHAAVRALSEGLTHMMASWSPPCALPGDSTIPFAPDPRVSLVQLNAVLEETDRMLTGRNSFVAWRQRLLAQIESVLAS